MNLIEAINVLNPVVENKFTKYKSRDVHWVFDVKGSFVASDRDGVKVSISYYNPNNKEYANWAAVGTVEWAANFEIVKIYLYKDTSYEAVEALKQTLPEIPIDMITRSRY